MNGGMPKAGDWAWKIHCQW